MASMQRGSWSRPSLDMLDTSMSGGTAQVTEGNYDEEETVESVMNKLAIERKVQYGAEKMLDVIEQRTGSEASETKERITAQLEAAANRIRELEAQLDRLKLATPARSRRRPQPRLNGFGSSSSLSIGQTMSTSLSSSALLAAQRPHMSRQGSRLTPDREHLDVLPALIPLPTTPSRAGSSTGIIPSSGRSHSRKRSLSTGAESLGSPRPGDGFGISRLGWLPSSTSPGDIAEEENHSASMIESAVAAIARLKELGTRRTVKGKEVDRGDEACQCMSKLAAMLKKTPSLRLLLSVDDIVESALLFLGDSSTARKRSAAYRLLRHVLDRQAWGKMLEAGMEWLIIRTFTRDAKHVHEREQALRLLRSVTTLPAPPAPTSRPSSSRANRRRSRSRTSHSRLGSSQDPIDVFTLILEQKVPLTDGILRSLISVAENPDDALRTICMQTLVEVGLVDIDRLIQTDAFRIVLLVLKDGPSELGPSVAALLAFLANMPHTRHRLVPGSDLESALVGFTEDQGKPSIRQQALQMEKIQATVRHITILLNTWSGFLYLCMDGRRAISALISSLLVRNDDLRDALLNLLFTIFRIKLPAWKDAFLDGKRLTVYNRAQEAVSSTLQEGYGEAEPSEPVTLIDQYVALLLATFIQCGLLDRLVTLIGENVNSINRKATLLLGEILSKSSQILPLQYAAQVQALPRLFAASMDFSDPISRSSALSALSSIGSLDRNHQRGGGPSDKSATGRIPDSLLRGQKQVQQARLRMGLQLDDRQFIQMINDTGVILNRDHTKWNYDLVMELLEGPLLNAKRLDEAIKATKFIRRLFAFFHPYSGRFSSIKRTRPNQKWVKLGCTLMTTMLVNPEGVRYLSEDRLLWQLADCLSNIDERSNNRSSSTPIFTRDRIDKTLTHGYFEILGVLTKHREGMQILEKFRIFSPLYHLTEQPARDVVVRFAIECFDYSLDGHPRIILSKALTTSTLTTRLFATHQLGRILHDHPALDDWALQLMITQLYDTAIEICDVAVMYLEEVCKDPIKLEKVVAMRPALEHLGDIGHPLFLRFVATSIGFEYLKDAQYIDRELDIWLSEKNLLYVIEVETWVSQTLRPFSSDTVEDYWTYDGTAPSHFFGELTKTPEGCQFLRDNGIVEGLAAIVRSHGLEPGNDTILTNLKCALWALGNIGSTDGGLPFLEDEEIIEQIVEIAEQSPILSMRGTAFFVLGLLSTSREGAELLEELGWISTRTAMGATTGLCLPTDLDRFAAIQPWSRVDNTLGNAPLPKLMGLEGEIMTSIANLSNHVLAASAMNNLKRIRNRHLRYFSSITLFHRALRIISTNHYPAPVRRFILDLFDIQINAETLVQLRHIELTSFAQPPMANLHEHADEHSPTMNTDHDHDHEHEHRRRSASYPGPERPAAARKRGLTISAIPNSSGIDGPDHDGMIGDGEEGEERHLPRERVQGFGKGERRTSVASSSRNSSAPMSRQSSQSGQRLLNFNLDPAVETLA